MQFTYRSTPLALASVLALITQASSPAVAQQSVSYIDLGNWQITGNVDSEAAGSGVSCSAVLANSSINGSALDSLRVERVNDGYLFGINGYSREGEGQGSPMAFWFDNTRADLRAGATSFYHDPSFELDDWLSHFSALGEQDSPVDQMRGEGEMFFAVIMPGNRTGNDEVVLNFDLTGANMALAALDTCYDSAASQQAIALNCPDDGPRFSGSGKCVGRAVNYMSLDPEFTPPLPDNCEWDISEAAMPGDQWLLYVSATCDGVPTVLEFSAGARRGVLEVMQSSFAGPREIATVQHRNGLPLTDAILSAAQAGIDNDYDRANGVVIKQDIYGDNAYGVDLDPAIVATLPQNGPRGACGAYRYDEETRSYWAEMGDYVVHVDLGQHAYQDVDPQSLVVVDR